MLSYLKDILHISIIVLNIDFCAKTKIIFLFILGSEIEEREKRKSEGRKLTLIYEYYFFIPFSLSKPKNELYISKKLDFPGYGKVSEQG